jgi:hypothetical protein
MNFTDYLGGLSTSTADEYRYTFNYVNGWKRQADSEPFIDFRGQGLAGSTVARRKVSWRLIISRRRSTGSNTLTAVPK